MENIEIVAEVAAATGNFTGSLKKNALNLLSLHAGAEDTEITMDNTHGFKMLSEDFSQYHQDPVNVMLHFFTTPLGLLGFFCLLRSFTNTSTPGCIVVLAYTMSLVPVLPFGAFVGTVAMCLFILWACRSAGASKTTSMCLIVAGYVLQDLSHMITGEKTFQQSYSAGGHVDTDNMSAWSQEFVNHTYYLLPLCVQVALPLMGLPKDSLDALNSAVPKELQQVYNHMWVVLVLGFWAIGGYCLDSANGFCMFPAAPYKCRVLQCNIKEDAQKRSENRRTDMKAIRDWAIKKMPREDMSTHWWVRDLPEKERAAFDRCAKSAIIERMFRKQFDERHYGLDIVHGMNEVYVTGPARSNEAFNSDQIFYAKHVDGPFALMPFASVFRCIVGMDKNMMISTIFPTAHVTKNCCEGDVLAFDFNREPHYIERDASKKDLSDKFRVVLKLHYAMYPRILAPLGWLYHHINVNYNITFRALFLKTINPQTLWEHFLASQVILQTWVFNTTETLIGQKNLVYIGMLLVLWRITGRYEVFLVCTSFVHYCRYIGTYYCRSGIDFGCFKRDVLFFKTLALIQLCLFYAFPGFMSGASDVTLAFDPISVAMIVAGYATSMLATKALGIDRTYFGSELGMPDCEPKWITDFPYGYIPHPMITSQVVALLGFAKAEHFRVACPSWVIPLHVGLYLTHMMQEHFDIHWGKYEDIADAQKQKAA